MVVRKVFIKVKGAQRKSFEPVLRLVATFANTQNITGILTIALDN